MNGEWFLGLGIKTNISFQNFHELPSCTEMQRVVASSFLKGYYLNNKVFLYDEMLKTESKVKCKDKKRHYYCMVQK